MAEDNTEALVMALAARMGLTVAPENLAAVVANFDLLTRMAAAVEGGDDEPTELATVFRA